MTPQAPIARTRESLLALVYATESATAAPRADEVLLLARFRNEAHLEIRVRNDWKSVADPEDHSYISDLLFDLELRAKTAPAELFDQISTLSVGPLVSLPTSNLDPQMTAILLKLWESFSPLWFRKS